jgi:exodeoxyribonuclease VII small subunit
MSKAKDKPVKFEEAVEQLQAIIEQIESGQVGLEESLAQYERGMKLVAQCRAILATAEKRIAELTVTASGKLQQEDESGDVEAADERE